MSSNTTLSNSILALIYCEKVYLCQISKNLIFDTFSRFLIKILTLINNDRITLPEQVSLLFEVEDLAVASPATVSRAGMVYNDYKDLGWRPYVDSWLEKYESQPEFVEEVRK